jgi:hypothetical protein
MTAAADTMAAPSVGQAVTGSVAQDEEQGQAKQDEARLRLFANIYSNQVAHLTTGMRIGRPRLQFPMHMPRLSESSEC